MFKETSEIPFLLHPPVFNSKMLQMATPPPPPPIILMVFADVSIYGIALLYHYNIFL